MRILLHLLSLARPALALFLFCWFEEEALKACGWLTLLLLYKA